MLTKHCVNGSWFIRNCGNLMSAPFSTEAAADRYIMFMDNLPTDHEIEQNRPDEKLALARQIYRLRRDIEDAESLTDLEFNTKLCRRLTDELLMTIFKESGQRRSEV